MPMHLEFLLSPFSQIFTSLSLSFSPTLYLSKEEEGKRLLLSLLLLPLFACHVLMSPPASSSSLPRNYVGKL